MTFYKPKVQIGNTIVMGEGIIFPFDINRGNLRAYYFAIQLARKLNQDLSPFITTNRFLGRFDNSEEYKSKLSLERKNIYNLVLELNGFYQAYFNQWNLFSDIRIRPIIKQGSIEEALRDYIAEKDFFLLLMDYNSFRQDILSRWNMDVFSGKRIRVCILPMNNAYFADELNPTKKLFEYHKKIFNSEWMENIKHYYLPDELAILLKDFSPSLSGTLID